MDNSNKIAIVWSSRDKDVAEKVAFMYAGGAVKQGWFDEVVLIVWGPSSKTLAEDKELQNKVRELMEAVITVLAVGAGARDYGATVELTNLGLDVLPMGGPLTEYLKDGWKMLTF